MKYKLSDLFLIFGGGTPKTQNADYWNGDIPWISVADMSSSFRYIETTEKTITDKGLKESSTKLLRPGDIIISARGTVGVINQVRIPMAFNQTCYGLRAKQDIVDQNYLYYLLLKQVPELQQLGHGAVFNTITRESFGLISVDLPPLETQKEIAHILGILDDKIELNRKMNKTLEEIAQTLFKHWFIDFEFPNVEGKPYKSSGGEMVDSELGQIPKGWDVACLGSKTKLTKGVSYKSTELIESNTALVTLKSFARGGGYQSHGLKSFTGAYKKEQILNAGDVIIACTDVTQNAEVVGRRAIVGDNQNYDTLVASLDTLIVRPDTNDITKSFVYFLAGTDAFNAHMLAHATGTTVLHLAKEAVPSFSYTHPDRSMMFIFDKTASALMNKMGVNEKESKLLSYIKLNAMSELFKLG